MDLDQPKPSIQVADRLFYRPKRRKKEKNTTNFEVYNKFDFITNHRLIYITLRNNNDKNRTKQHSINNNIMDTLNYQTNLTALLKPLIDNNINDPEEINRLICTKIKKAVATNKNKAISDGSQ